MTKRIFLLAIVIFSTILFVNAQNEVILTIGKNDVSKTEFERIFKKNNTGEINDAKSVEEYMELFINFKLKVIEAQSLGLDTTQAFIKELAGYRKQLAKPYFVDENIEESLIKQAFDRLKKDVHAAHILIKIAPDASPEDSLIAYNKILKAKQRIEKGETFEKVAGEVSEDNTKDKGGDLGYFTAFQMIYEFENAAYNTVPGKISDIFRTRFGYHIVKTHEIRETLGEIRVAHIMVTFPQGSTDEEQKEAEEKINMVYEELQKGGDFAQLAKEYSIDKQSSEKGGELPWFRSGRMGMVPEFEEAAFQIEKNGDYTKPVKTSYSWHIIKLIDKRDLGTYDDLKADIKTKISRDARANKSRQAVIEKLKKEYGFKENAKACADFYKAVDESFVRNEWTLEKAKNLNKTLFSFAGMDINQKEFAEFLFLKQGKKVPSVKEFIDLTYEKFVDEKVSKYEEGRLEEKYPDFKYLMREYHDGILLFELTDQLVWSKAVKDTVGLQSFYNKNKDKYMWAERCDATVYFCKDEATKKAVEKILKKKESKGYTNDDILKMVNTTEDKKLRIESGVYQQGENRAVDHFAWNLFPQEEISKVIKREYLYEGTMIKPINKTLDEAKGLVTADYQEFLEKEWIKELRNKYEITVNKEVLNTVK